MLHFENISADILQAPVLRGIQASLPQGSLSAVVGRNGAGKTTLLRAIMGFVPLRGGRILLDDSDLAKVPAHGRARLGIGYAPQERVMFPTLTVEENLRLPCQVIGMSRAEVDARLALTLEVAPQLKEMLPRSGAALSGGQGKMAAFGRALMVGTRLILLDEPFQGLAPALAGQYGEALKRLQQRAPELCVVITESNGSLLRDLPDHVLHIERGALLPDQAALTSVAPVTSSSFPLEAYP
ncbi:ABC transporter ATP-binding protein [Phytopseudomonas seleniipraecipitans]|uniref:Amino acid/amide ABC transporter ATP-binding protein 2, HAAT family n=1 Tax=Phytopseudomonas seleniipraecipitans TaxID=640205 RepID=A0A1G7SUX8_9GAMM|nr:ATP-binding cassette domain-containing protein [Pseudomonas seleniipraecipitans]SDG26771.1 amino acid/amide ABC transporter ATP-binding protein 2, HAAT family [Pseudomonas seleniipraecipitans]